MADEHTFTKFSTAVQRLISSAQHLGFIAVHPRVHSKEAMKDVATREAAQYSATLLLRLIFLIGLFLTADSPVMLIIPFLGSASLIDFDTFDKCRRSLSSQRFFGEGELQFEVWSNCEAPLRSSTLQECTDLFIAVITNRIERDYVAPDVQLADLHQRSLGKRRCSSCSDSPTS